MRLPLQISIVSLIAAAPLLAQSTPQLPGSQDASKISGGTYQVDPAHTLIGFRVNHFGFNDYFGIFGNSSGSLTLDPANPGSASVNITIPVKELTTASKKLTTHLNSADFFDTTNNETATFVSTKVTTEGEIAEITGDLTIKGITRPVILSAQFTGAGINPFNKKETIGFESSTVIKRSDFGIKYGLPMVSDEVTLDITAAFEK